jgi:uncharacterized protein YwgA
MFKSCKFINPKISYTDNKLKTQNAITSFKKINFKIISLYLQYEYDHY